MLAGEMGGQNLTFDLIARAAERPDAPALLVAEREISYGALDALVWRCAQQLHDEGVRPNDVVALSFVEDLGIAIAMLAVIRLGATIVSVPRSATALQRQEMRSAANVSFLASDKPELFDLKVRTIAVDIAALGKRSTAFDTAIMVENPEAPWEIVIGSGSTGRPKVIPISHSQERDREPMGRALVFTPEDRVRKLSHFDFKSPKTWFLRAIKAGAATAVADRSPADIVALCRKQKISILAATAFHAERLLDSLPADTRDALPGVRAFVVSGSLVSDDLRRRIREKVTANVFVRYAANEVGPITIAGPPEVFEIPGTVGMPAPGVEIQIVDADGNVLSPGLVGFIRVRTLGLIDGYLNQKIEAAGPIADGWFTTGDLGRLTEDGQLIHFGRGDRMMILNGMNIYPAEIEQAILSHPAVRDAVAMPLKHRVHGDIPICAVELRAGAKATESALHGFARERLGPRCPRQVLILDRIPRNEHGKLDRTGLDALIAEMQASGRRGKKAHELPPAAPHSTRTGSPPGAEAAPAPDNGPAAYTARKGIRGRNITFGLIEQAKATPKAPVLLLPEREVSYAELDALVWRCAQHLYDHGVRRGDVVALSFENDLGIVVSMLAVARLGASVISVPQSATALQREEMRSRANIGFLACDRPVVFDLGVRAIKVDTAALEKRDASFDSTIMDATPQAPCELVMGSGSTGRPKLLPLSHAQQEGREFSGSVLSLTSDDRVCTLSHFDFKSPKTWLFRVLKAGASIAVPGRVVDDIPSLCEKHNISILVATVFHAEKLIRGLPPNTRMALPGLRALLVSSSLVGDPLRRRIRETLTGNLFVRYNTNEVGQITIVGPPEVFEIPGTVGRAAPGVEIQIVDADGQPVSPGSVGFVRTRTPGTIDGYADDDGASKNLFKDGWFTTGDLGRMTADGHLIHMGRGDRMMILNGINIYPAEIEHVMTGHPAVSDAVAIPLKHPVHGDIPICVVQTNGTAATETSLQAYGQKHLGPRSPWFVFIFDRIPRNEQGKLDRASLDAMIAQRRASRGSRVDKQASSGAARPTQRAMTVEVRFSCAPGVDIARLDNWLTDVLRIERKPISGSGGNVPERRRHAFGFLSRVLLLTQELLQISGAPVFDEPKILALRRDGEGRNTWRASVQLAQVENLPRPAYETTLRASLRICSRAAASLRNDKSIASLLATMEREALPKLRQLITAGASTVPVLRVAHRQGIPFSHLGGGVYQLGWGARSRRLYCSASERDSAMGAMLAQNKVNASKLLRLSSLPGPTNEVVASLAEARAAAQSLGWPVVTKPVDRDRGEGVTVDVRNEKQLETAFLAAHKISGAKRVIVERQVAGVCHRVFVANGKLLYAVKRLPIGVRGNGRHTVSELVTAEVKAQERKPSWLRSKIRKLDATAHAALKAAGLSADSVPAPGAFAPLRPIESTAWGGVDEDVTAIIHPENIAIALRAAELFQLRVAGIDIMSTDISKPWYDTGAIINEVNFAPLLGGGEISRAHIGEFLEGYVEGDGRIPIEVFVGGAEAMRAAKARQRELTADGTRCYLTNHERTTDFAGREIRLARKGLYRRARALLLQPDVEALILCVQNDEVLRRGLPVDRVDRVVEADESAIAAESRTKVLRQLHALAALAQ
jgi:acyl-coenzyme A synthetase/AMP-(fatty) acid ligase